MFFIYRVFVDNDGDGIHNLDETNTGIYVSPSDTGTDPENADTDGDNLNDGEELLTYFTNPHNSDSDQDGLNDYDEINVHLSNPNSEDTDNDGYLDKLEVYLSQFDVNNDSSSLILSDVNLYTAEQIKDLRAGSAIIEVENGVATLIMEVEQSDDLDLWRPFNFNIGEPYMPNPLDPNDGRFNLIRIDIPINKLFVK